MYRSIRDELDACPDLCEADKLKLEKIAQDMPFVADISRSDMLLYALRSRQKAVLIAQASPHSTVPIHAPDMLGHWVTPQDEATLFRTLRYRLSIRGNRRMVDGGAPAVQQAMPIFGQGNQVIGGLSIETSLIAFVRQKTRSKIFQRAVRILQAALLAGELEAVSQLSPFAANDGILVADSQHIIRYASGIATEQYRKLGYLDNLVGRNLVSLDTGDEEMCTRVLQDLKGREKAFEERQRKVIRKAVPLIARVMGITWQQPWKWSRRRAVGALLTIHDATEEQKKERELKIKSAMIREIHHRVKNNLQTVAAILRSQGRRSGNDEVRKILNDSVSRILSVAVVHEYLSREEGQAINIRDVTRGIIQQTQEGMLTPEKQIVIKLEEGNNLYLPARQATACALVINELLQNALEHGFGGRHAGAISVDLRDEGESVRVIISDDGSGLPSNFDLGHPTSMGLQIVQMLVQEDLAGTIEITSNGGVCATVQFSKKVFEGEESWNG